MELPGRKSIFLRRYNVFDYIRDMMAAERSACAAIFLFWPEPWVARSELPRNGLETDPKQRCRKC
jgi:hypothetical protein